MNHTTRLLLLAAIFCALLACLPSLTQCYVILEEEDFEDPDVETEWKRGYAGRVIPDPVPRAPMTLKSMSRFLQNLASRRLVSDPEMAKRQVNVGLRLVTFDTLRNHLETIAASRARQQLRHNQEIMSRVGRRR